MKHISARILIALFAALLLFPVLAGCGGEPKLPSAPDFSGETLAAGEARMSFYLGKSYLRWGAAEGAQGYKLYHSQTLYGEYLPLDAALEGTQYTAQADCFDYFRVTAVTEEGEVPLCEPVSAFTNTLIVGPDDDMGAVQDHIDRMHERLESGSTGQFSSLRFSILLLPGVYDLDVKVGYYTTVSGLGGSPRDVVISSLYVSDRVLGNQNATCTFWRGAENLTVAGNTTWAVSQATSLRRVRVEGNLKLSYSGWSSGGFLANSEVTGTVDPGSQQQWFSRNSKWQRWSHAGSHNYVFSGCEGSVPTGAWTESGVRSTVLSETERIAEKPFLVFREGVGYSVFVPALQRNAAGVTWGEGISAEKGYFLPLEEFYIANEFSDTAETLNAALRSGKDVFFPAGQYELSAPLEVTREGTVALGLGYATLKISDENTLGAIRVADVGGVRLGDFLIDAGAYSTSMVVIGDQKSDISHADDPIVLSNLYLRIGGVENVHTETGTAMIIRANDTIGDNFWIWRADHSQGVAWEDTANRDGSVSYGNPAVTGLRVEGDNVSCYALMVEHFEGFQTDWRGENGLTVMYQSETPYRVPSQAAWMSHDGAKNGCASYRVAENVSTHRAYGIGIYLVNYNSVTLDSAIEAPEGEGIRMEHLVVCDFTQSYPARIENVINDYGGSVGPSPSAFRRLVERYPVPLA